MVITCCTKLVQDENGYWRPVCEGEEYQAILVRDVDMDKYLPEDGIAVALRGTKAEMAFQ